MFAHTEVGLVALYFLGAVLLMAGLWVVGKIESKGV